MVQVRPQQDLSSTPLRRSSSDIRQERSDVGVVGIIFGIGFIIGGALKYPATTSLLGKTITLGIIVFGIALIATIYFSVLNNTAHQSISDSWDLISKPISSSLGKDHPNK